MSKKLSGDFMNENLQDSLRKTLRIDELQCQAQIRRIVLLDWCYCSENEDFEEVGGSCKMISLLKYIVANALRNW